MGSGIGRGKGCIWARWEGWERSWGSGRALAVRLQPVTLKETRWGGGDVLCVYVFTGCSLTCLSLIFIPHLTQVKRGFPVLPYNLLRYLGARGDCGFIWVLFLKFHCSRFVIYNDVYHHPVHLPHPCPEFPSMKEAPHRPSQSPLRARCSGAREEVRRLSPAAFDLVWINSLIL